MLHYNYRNPIFALVQCVCRSARIFFKCIYYGQGKDMSLPLSDIILKVYWYNTLIIFTWRCLCEHSIAFKFTNKVCYIDLSCFCYYFPEFPFKTFLIEMNLCYFEKGFGNLVLEMVIQCQRIGLISTFHYAYFNSVPWIGFPKLQQICVNTTDHNNGTIHKLFFQESRTKYQWKSYQVNVLIFNCRFELAENK